MKSLRLLRDTVTTTARRQLFATDSQATIVAVAAEPGTSSAASPITDSAALKPQAFAHLTEQPLPTPRCSHKSFYADDLEIVRAEGAQLQPKPEDGKLVFGHTYADHMAEADWNEDRGWTRPLISPLHDFRIHPGSKALHYAIQLFEGMKAYRGVDNRIRLFRPEMNMARMRRTAERASLPDFLSEELIRIISELVSLDREWVPYSGTASLYLRPTLIGTDNTLGVGHPRDAKLFVVTGPVSAYYRTGFQPITLYADGAHVRAFPGGVGAFKMGCNYAPTIRVSKRAAELGCQQVLWLYGEDEKLTEVGTMNIFLYWTNELGEEELVTPPLTDGLILPGVTRESVLELARERNLKVSERYPTMNELRQALADNRVRQIFGAGTACVVSPVGKILYRRPDTNTYESWKIPTIDGNSNLMQRLYDTIIDIQYGRSDLKPDWVHIVD